MTLPLFLTLLSHDILNQSLSLWLDLRSIATLDIAVSSETSRSHWMSLLHSLRASAIDDWGHSIPSLMWLTKRGINSSKINIMVDAWRVRGCDLITLQMNDLLHLGLNDCYNMTDQCILNMIHQLRKLISVDLYGCESLLD